MWYLSPWERQFIQMANTVELRKLVKDMLNNNVTDFYANNQNRPTLQEHFYDESDGINLSRGNTFPKGYVKISNAPTPVKTNVGRTGYTKKYGTIRIYYYTKENQSYTANSIVYKNEDLINLALDNIHDSILNHRVIGYHLFPTSVVKSNEISQVNQGNFKLYLGSLTVTYYWYENYG